MPFCQAKLIISDQKGTELKKSKVASLTYAVRDFALDAVHLIFPLNSTHQQWSVSFTWGYLEGAFCAVSPSPGA